MTRIIRFGDYLNLTTLFDGLPPGLGIGVGGTLGGLMLLQDYMERKETLKPLPVPQDATKYTIPKLRPR